MAGLNDYSDAIQEIKEAVVTGQYGDNPFDFSDPTNEGAQHLFAAAYQAVGQYCPDLWTANEVEDGGIVMSEIRGAYDAALIDIANKADPATTAAWDVEREDEFARQNPKVTETIDDIMQKSEDPQALIDSIKRLNEMKIANGESPVYLQQETIDALAEKGADASTLATPSDRSDNDAAHESKIDQNSNSSVEKAEPMSVESASAPVEKPETASGLPEKIPNATEKMELFSEQDADGKIIDLYIKSEDGSETRLSDILADIAKEDPAIADIFKSAIEISDNGGDWRTFLNDSIEKYAAGKPDIEKEKPETSIPNHDSNGNDFEKGASNKQSVIEERFQHHSDIVDERRSVVVSYRRDTITAYHEMAKVYNAWKGNIEINGQVPTFVDVFISFSNFANSNPFETLIIEALREICDVLAEHKEDVEKSGVEKAEHPTDSLGIREDGQIDRKSSDKEINDISQMRTKLPNAGISYGAKMEKADREWTSKDGTEVKIRSTNPDMVGGRGIAITTDDAQNAYIPDLRLIDFKGERILVDPFGRVLDSGIDGERFKPGQIISGFDSTGKNERTQGAVETYAKDNHMSVSQARDALSKQSIERFCGRIESTYASEAKTIEKNVIPREQETLRDINMKIANLDTISKTGVASDQAGKIEQMRADLVSARNKMEARIDALDHRVTDLEKLAAKNPLRPLDERFKDAVSSEKGAVGRSVYSVDIGADMKNIKGFVDAGVEKIQKKVEKHNETKPELDRISYDPKSGTFVDRFGINNRGGYVGNVNGSFMSQDVEGPTSKEDVKDYVEKHYDLERFDVNAIMQDVDAPDNGGNQDVEQVDPDNTAADIEAMNETDTERSEQDPAEKPEADTTEKPEVEPTEKPEPDLTEKSEQNQTEKTEVDTAENLEQDPTEKHEQDPVDDPEKDAVEQPETDNIDTPDRDLVESPEGDSLDQPVNETNGADNPDNEDTDNPDKDTNNDTAQNEEDGVEGDDDHVDEDIEAKADDKDDIEVDDVDDADITVENNNGSNDPIARDDISGITGNGDSIKEDEDPDEVSVDNKEKDGQVSDVNAKTAIEAGDGSEKQSDREDKKDVPIETDSKKDDDDDTSIIDELKEGISEYFKDIFDNIDSFIDDPASFIENTIEAKFSSVVDAFDKLSNAESVADVAEIFSDAIMNEIEKQIAPIETMTDLVGKIFEHIGEMFGPEFGSDVVDHMQEAADGMGADADGHMQDIIDSAAEGNANSAEMEEPKEVEIDGMSISDEGVSDSITGEEITNFETPEEAEAFVDDVCGDVEGIIDKTEADFAIGSDDVELINDHIEASDDATDNTRPGQPNDNVEMNVPDHVDGNIDTGVDNGDMEDMSGMEEATSEEAAEEIIAAL